MSDDPGEWTETAEERADRFRAPTLLEMFEVRCEARAKLWAAGEFGPPDNPMSLHAAVDALVPAAVVLATEHGVSIEATQAILAKHFQVRWVWPKAAGDE